jgi:hypothetical protein
MARILPPLSTGDERSPPGGHFNRLPWQFRFPETKNDPAWFLPHLRHKSLQVNDLCDSTPSFCAGARFPETKSCPGNIFSL